MFYGVNFWYQFLNNNLRESSLQNIIILWDTSVAIRDLFLFQIVSEILSSHWQGTRCEMWGDSVNMLSPFMMDCPGAN